MSRPQKLQHVSPADLPPRRELEAYETEHNLIRQAYEMFLTPQFRGWYDQPLRVLDVGAGDGRWGMMVKDYFPHSEVTLLDIDPRWGGEGRVTCNVLEYNPSEPFDLIVGNPPYAERKQNAKGNWYSVKPPLWERIVQKSWGWLTRIPAGRIIMLLPLDGITGVDRYKNLFQVCPLRYFAPCARRPSHSGDGKTNANNLAVYVWDYTPRHKEKRTPEMYHLYYER